MIGARYGRLTVKDDLGVIDGRRTYLCKCDCDTLVKVKEIYLKNKDTQSCGCLKKDTEKMNLRKGYDSKRVDDTAIHLFDDKPRKDSSTGYRGVSLYYTRVTKQERYRAWITVKGKRYYKSGFLTAKDAYYKGRLKLEKQHLPERKDKNDKHK